jgi:hypothetical protein
MCYKILMTYDELAAQIAADVEKECPHAASHPMPGTYDWKLGSYQASLGRHDAHPGVLPTEIVVTLSGRARRPRVLSAHVDEKGLRKRLVVAICGHLNLS